MSGESMTGHAEMEVPFRAWAAQGAESLGGGAGPVSGERMTGHSEMEVPLRPERHRGLPGRRGR